MLTIHKKWPLLTAALCLYIFPATAAPKPIDNRITNQQAAEKAANEAAKTLSNWESLLVERKWKTDPSLSVKVSFTAQREPLGEFLVRLSKLGGTRFELSADSPFKAKKLTATVTEMPLREVIMSLNRLYGLTWDETPEGGYVAVGLPLNEVEKGIWKFGDLTSWASREQSMSGPKRKALAQELLRYLNAETLKTPVGQPLSAVPPELQAQVRKTIEWQSALSLLDTYSKALLPNIADASLQAEQRISTSKPGAETTEKAPTPITSVNFLDSQGKSLAPIGQFGVPLPVEAPKPAGPAIPEPIDDGRMTPF